MATIRSMERRSKKRFEMIRDLRYRVTEEGIPSVGGTGKTINISSSGAAFTVEHPLNRGAFVELSISWPALLDDTCPMRLVAFGRVLRCQGLTAVCSIDKYEFRTAGRTFQTTVQIVRTDGMLQRWADGMKKEMVKMSAGA